MSGKVLRDGGGKAMCRFVLLLFLAVTGLCGHSLAAADASRQGEDSAAAPAPAPTPANAASAPVSPQTPQLTARTVFAMLPGSLFESTVAGLDETEKQQLLLEGRSEFWELAGETEDVIVFTALPFRDGGVAVRLFRNEKDGSVLAAIGTLGGEMCTVELWRVDSSCRVVPVDTPQEPAVEEFFAEGQSLPADVYPSVNICLGNGGLMAVPIFWNATGMVHLPHAYDISYQWDGRRFRKLRTDHAAAVPSDGMAAPGQQAAPSR